MTKFNFAFHKNLGYKKRSSKKQLEEKEDNLYALEQQRIQAEIKKFEAETFYFQEKTRQSQVLFLLKEKNLLNET